MQTLRVLALGLVGATLVVSGCSGAEEGVEPDEPVVMPCADAAGATTDPAAYVPPPDRLSTVSTDYATQAAGVLLSSPEFGPCLRTGAASIWTVEPWMSATGKGLVGVVAVVAFPEPVDLPRTVEGWGPVGEGNQLPEDDLGLIVTEEVPRSARSQVRVERVMVALVGEPHVHAASRFA